MTVGPLTLHPLDPQADAAVVHDWVTRPYARFWGMQDASLDDVTAAYAGIDASPHHDAFLGRHDGEPAFLVERYDPRHAEVGRHYVPEPGDVGMHFLVGPTDDPVPGFTRAVITAAMRLCFADPAARRVVVEPDARNDKVHALNAAVGFEVAGPITLSDKEALLSFCTRAQFAAAVGVSA